MSSSSDPDIERFVGHVLKVVAEQLDAPVTEYWSNSENIACLELSCWQGEIVTKEQLSQDPRTRGIEIPPEMVHHEALEQRQHYFIVEELPTDPVQLSVFSPLGFGLEAWCRERGVRKLLNVPLRLGNKSIGALCVYIPVNRCLSEQQLELSYALAQQVTLAIRLSQLAEEAKQVAIAREQERAATERAAELAKANNALQATIDAMAEIEDLDEFIPAVLKIVAQTFQAGQTENCAYYEHSTEDRVYLRYWLFENRIFRPEELLALDGDRFALIGRLAGGFTVPDAYLGTPVRERTQAVILDHIAGTPDPEFDEFTCANGWHMELNVPLVVDGCADGALVVYRKAGEKFTRAEVTLAESLGKQLALAMQANRLAKESKSKAVETAIAREQEKAATERAEQLAKANNALKRNLDSLATQPQLEAFLQSVVNEAAAQTNAESVCLFLYDEQIGSLSLSVATCKQKPSKLQTRRCAKPH